MYPSWCFTTRARLSHTALGAIREEDPSFQQRETKAARDGGLQSCWRSHLWTYTWARANACAHTDTHTPHRPLFTEEECCHSLDDRGTSTPWDVSWRPCLANTGRRSISKVLLCPKNASVHLRGLSRRDAADPRRRQARVFWSLTFPNPAGYTK